jgi:DNA repair protein RAD50
MYIKKVAGFNEVKAQVKLKFYNVNGEKMICSRSLAVSKKKASVTMKSIDNSLLRYDNQTGEVKNKNVIRCQFFILNKI